MKSPLYYNPGTPSSGSADPLRHAMQMRSVLRTGWGPRGDSGSARGRVRATQPASFFFCFPLHFKPEHAGGRPTPRLSFSFAAIGNRLASYSCRMHRYFHKVLSNECVKNNLVGAI